MTEFITEINSDNFDELINKPLTLVYTTAVWCGPCRALSPIVDEVSNQFKDTILIGKLDADSNTDLVSKLGIRGIPTIVFFKDGVEVDRISGAQSKQTLINLIDKHNTSTFSTEDDF
jgi:thioredoxin 1